MKDLSIIICTYNPSEKIFSKCLQYLQDACEEIDNYEVLIIDNNSETPVTKLASINCFLEKQPNARLLLEKKQGLTMARLKGCIQAVGKWLVFIDDDNFIDSNFLKEGLDISRTHSQIGAFSGQINLIFDKEPGTWTRPYWGLLVYRPLEKDVWSNLPHLTDTMPCGAGLFVKKEVADFYYDLHKSGKRPIQLDRIGNNHFSAGDNDLAACACDIGLGVGLFTALKLNHFIPKNRVTENYLLNLAEGIAASTVVFKYFRGVLPLERSVKNRVADFLRLLLKRGIDKKFFKRVKSGEKQGRLLVQKCLKQL